jgi:hypothetical protein
MTMHKMTQFYTMLFSVCNNITAKFRTTAILKNPSMKLMIQVELIGISIIVHCTKLHLCKCNSSKVVSIKQNVNLKFQPPAIFTFFGFRKCTLIKSCSSFKDLSAHNSMVPRWLVQFLHPPQKFERPPFCNGWSYGIKTYGVEATFNSMISLLNFIFSIL